MALCARCPKDAPQLRRGLCSNCYQKARRAGEVVGYVDATPAKSTIAALHGRGWTYREIGRAAGLDRSAIEYIIRRGRRQINADTAAAIAKIDPATHAHWKQYSWDARQEGHALKRWLRAEQAWQDRQIELWIRAENVWLELQRQAEEEAMSVHRARASADVTRQSFTGLASVAWIDPEQDPWKTDALCAQVDPEIFFPETGGSNKEAKRICERCIVKDECLDAALAGEERFGIWGGLSERERRRLKKGLPITDIEEAM